MNRQLLLQQRLHNQRLHASSFATAEEVVRWMGAVQGQDYGPGLWAIGLRAPMIKKTDILQALEEKKIVRSWTMRHTIHFTALEDVRWMVQLTKERMLKRYKNHMKTEANLEEPELRESLDVIEKALEGKRLLSRPAMREALEEAGIDTSKQRLYHILWYAAQNGLVFIGPMEGKQQTFGLVNEWAPEAQVLTNEEALQKLALRYLQSHGPASAKDFSWWSGVTQKEAQLGFDLSEAELFDRDDKGVEYWYVPTYLPTSTGSNNKIHLIYSLDEFLIGYKDRTALWSEAQAEKLDPGKTGYVFPILLEGEVIGSWRPRVKKQTLSMQFTLATPKDIPREWLNKEAERYGNFFDLPLADVNVQRI